MSRRSIPRLKKARYVDGFRIELTYEDGTRGVVDLKGDLWGEAFKALEDLDVFKSFRVDRGFSTLVWPNDADIAPETLYERARVSGGAPPSRPPKRPRSRARR